MIICDSKHSQIWVWQWTRFFCQLSLPVFLLPFLVAKRWLFILAFFALLLLSLFPFVTIFIYTIFICRSPSFTVLSLIVWVKQWPLLSNGECAEFIIHNASIFVDKSPLFFIILQVVLGFAYFYFSLVRRIWPHLSSSPSARLTYAWNLVEFTSRIS
jgi:hypothetical protein